MSYDELLVGAVAIIMAIIAAAIAAGPWEAPYRLRTVSAVSRRYGKTAARVIWMAIALASFIAGLAIVSGTRPSYAAPVEHNELDRAGTH